jgi:hypothetical protein
MGMGLRERRRRWHRTAQYDPGDKIGVVNIATVISHIHCTGKSI